MQIKPLNDNINKGNTLDAHSNIGDVTLVLRTRILGDFKVYLYRMSCGIWYVYDHFVQCTYNFPIW